MCDSLLFINNGRIVHHGDAESLKHGTENGGGYFYDVQVLGDAQSVSDWTVTNPYTEFIESRKNGGRIRVESAETAARVLASMVKDGLQVVEFHKEQRNLEDAFIDMLDKVNTPPPMPPEETQNSNT